MVVFISERVCALNQACFIRLPNTSLWNRHNENIVPMTNSVEMIERSHHISKWKHVRSKSSENLRKFKIHNPFVSNVFFFTSNTHQQRIRHWRDCENWHTQKTIVKTKTHVLSVKNKQTFIDSNPEHWLEWWADRR